MCADCETASQQLWHGFMAQCPGCQARALSRGPEFAESAARRRQSSEYVAQLKRLGLTHEQVKAAHAADAINKG